MNADQFADSVSVFDQNLADLNDYGDGLDRNGARSNELYAGLPLKDEPFEYIDDRRFDPFSDLDAEVAALSSAASTSNDNGFHRPPSTMYGMLRNIDSPTLNLSQVIEWSDYFSNATKTENETDTTTVESSTATAAEQNATENYRNVRVKLESEGDDDHQSSSDDCKNSTSGFSSNVELTEEVTKRKQTNIIYSHKYFNRRKTIRHCFLLEYTTNVWINEMKWNEKRNKNLLHDIRLRFNSICEWN